MSPGLLTGSGDKDLVESRGLLVYHHATEAGRMSGEAGVRFAA
jgi:hypothetical protein